MKTRQDGLVARVGYGFKKKDQPLIRVSDRRVLRDSAGFAADFFREGVMVILPCDDEVPILE